MVGDRIGDFIIRLKNAAAIGRRRVSTPYSAHLLAIAKKVKELGFATDVDIGEGEGPHKLLFVTLAYDERGVPRLRGVKRVSAPGRRLYLSHRFAHRVKGGTGARILSSPSGIITDSEARAKKVGGEELFEIW